ncbi:4Fe-4S dicluster domain-containing protein [Halodesulfurarchaeum sp.]|uniref:4Fe-4S dicluster domain-containing protein n=1 Tax=Halodesulfurarchaeum sp. TaxID=1980530 RepID=UPI001BBDED50|nr:4Fe-4S dicluster domain-containing protein [Halodesulfurarchaeum sp.]
MTKRVIPDVDRCIDCGGCEVACKVEWDIGHSEERIEIVTHNEGRDGTRYTGGESHTPMQCYNCAEAPCIDVCPTDALHRDEHDLVQVDKDLCIGCSYCSWACPFGAPQYPTEEETAGGAGIMDKCTTCKPRLEEGKDPACVETCPTDALIYGTASEISDEMRRRGSDTMFTEGEAGVVFGTGSD